MGQTSPPKYCMKRLLLLLAILSFTIYTLPIAYSAEKTPTYKINFPQVVLSEYVRFVGKICNANFLFDEKELNIPVSIVSQEAISPDNIMAILIQILRVHGFSIMEENHMLVIHKNDAVKSIAHIITSDMTSQNNLPPIVTCVFAIKTGNINTISNILKGMLSKDAAIQISQETNQIIITDFSVNIQKIQELINQLESTENSLKIQTYNVKNGSANDLVNLAYKILAPLTASSTFLLVPQIDANIIYITATPKFIEKALETLKELDVPSAQTKQLKTENIFTYKPKYQHANFIVHAISDVAQHLLSSGYPEQGLVKALNSAKILKDNYSIMFTGTKEDLPTIQNILATIDISDSYKRPDNSFFLYKPKNISCKQLLSTSETLAEKLKQSDSTNQDLIYALNNAQYIKDLNVILFTSTKKALSELETLLNTSIDINKASTQDTVFIYQPKNMSSKQLIAAIHEITPNMQTDNNEDLINSLNNVKFVKESNSLIFKGSSYILKEIETIIKNIDAQQVKQTAIQNFLLYEPKNITQQKLEKHLKDIAGNLNDPQEIDLKQCILNMKWLPESNSFMFSGSETSLNRLKTILTNFENSTKSTSKPTYFLYKLKNASGQAVENYLDSFAKNIKEKKLGKETLIDAINNIKWVKETNSILITGDATTIEEIKKLIAEFDATQLGGKALAEKTEFFMYKPLHTPRELFEQKINDVCTNLQKAELADNDLISSLNSMKFVESNNAFVFTGKTDTLKKVQEIIKNIDTPYATSIQHVGKQTFLLYKLKNASFIQIKNSIKSLTDDLKKAKTADKAFLETLNSMKYVKETNSILFTGTDETLEKAQKLVENLDVRTSSDTKMTAGSFFIYKPKYLSGPALESILQDFVTHLKSSGFDNQELYNTINSMKWIENTKSLVFTGSTKALDEVKNLLASFDVPSGKLETKLTDTPIQPINNISFLVYKLQYHKGDEIQTALKQIATNLNKQTPKVDNDLLTSINSVQWIEVTNSLLCSGPQDTIERLKELVKNLDLPLKQVFIEMLVIKTEMSNLLSFGLDWGGKFKYKNQLGASAGNFPYSSNVLANPFTSGLNSVNNTTFPNPNTQIPFQSGFDFGVIGDIIMHKGKSFISLGSLINALQTDSQVSTIMTPKIIAQDGKTSKIFSGENIPYIGSYVNQNGGAQTVQTQNLEYRDIGVNLVITPVLGNSDVVTLDIQLDQSNVLNPNTTIPNSNVSGITTARTNMSTTVHIPNKKFLILSGMVLEEKTKAKTGIPCLGGLPLIGAAFSENTDNNTRKNIVIFIRPHIINSYRDMNAIADNQEDYFRDYTGTPTLEQEFDESVDNLKSYGDEPDEEPAEE
jgi:type II secretory pathway component GspD/PulD (secretin)